MKWYSVKKYLPLEGSWVICRIWHKDGWDEYITARWITDYWDYGSFSSSCDEQEDDFKITHFCIPDPIEIEE
jgi:hypothetical protein